MLHDKSTKIISELKNYFSSNEKIFRTLFAELRSLKISDKYFLPVNKINTKYAGYQRFVLLILFPLLDLKHISDYKQSALYQIVKCGKDIFYRFINNPNFDWRKFSYSITKQLIKRVEKNSEIAENKRIKCLIADDTDMSKSGKKFEFLSRIYSHVSHSFNYGFKGLFLGYHDGTSFFSLDFSLHGEKGKDEKKPYGLTKKQQKARFSKKRNEKSAGKQRENEYFKKKTEMLIKMIKTAILQGIRFDYLLTDSWFCNFELVRFIKTRKIKCHFLGMFKDGKTQYVFNGKSLTFKQILHNLKHSVKMKKNRKLNCHFYAQIIDFKGIKVKIFFCKMGKNGVWHGILTTNTKLTFEQAFEIYATRWSIEVFFRDCKQYLRLGKCESRNFDAQIAATTLCMLQYNLLSVVKRFESYESLGALFRKAKSEIIELNVKERIWLIITQITTKLSDIFAIEIDILIFYIISDNQELNEIINFKTTRKNCIK